MLETRAPSYQHEPSTIDQFSNFLNFGSPNYPTPYALTRKPYFLNPNLSTLYNRHAPQDQRIRASFVILENSLPSSFNSCLSRLAPLSGNLRLSMQNAPVFGGQNYGHFGGRLDTGGRSKMSAQNRTMILTTANVSSISSHSFFETCEVRGLNSKP